MDFGWKGLKSEHTSRPLQLWAGLVTPLSFDFVARDDRGAVGVTQAVCTWVVQVRGGVRTAAYRWPALFLPSFPVTPPQQARKPRPRSVKQPDSRASIWLQRPSCIYYIHCPWGPKETPGPVLFPLWGRTLLPPEQLRR